jgi:hypothetical protein
VATPRDFGTRGAAPTHPELLDWLAARFLAEGSVKAMHRRIVLSRTYGLAAGATPLFGAHARRRLDAEAVRDAILAASGALDLEPGGAHPMPPMKTWGFSASRPFQAAYPTDKRSVFLVTGRVRNHPFLEIFDGADANLSTGERLAATSPLQALFFMNSAFMTEQSERFAKRAGGSVDLAYLLALGRPPTPQERRSAEGFAAGHGWPALARVILSSNEFIFIE